MSVTIIIIEGDGAEKRKKLKDAMPTSVREALDDVGRDVEMESGPYLFALYEFIRPRRYPEDELVNLYRVPFEVGVLHYASDTPISKGRNLGTRNLSYYGVDPTYATAVAVLRRILALET